MAIYDSLHTASTTGLEGDAGNHSGAGMVGRSCELRRGSDTIGEAPAPDGLCLGPPRGYVADVGYTHGPPTPMNFAASDSGGVASVAWTGKKVTRAGVSILDGWRRDDKRLGDSPGKYTFMLRAHEYTFMLRPSEED